MRGLPECTQEGGEEGLACESRARSGCQRREGISIPPGDCAAIGGARSPVLNASEAAAVKAALRVSVSTVRARESAVCALATSMKVAIPFRYESIVAS